MLMDNSDIKKVYGVLLVGRAKAVLKIKMTEV